MNIRIVKGLLIGLMMMGFWSGTVVSKADPLFTPTEYGGNFGLGLELGDPGTWGVVGKVWVDRRNAFQGAVKLGDSMSILQLDYLWHDFDLITLKEDSGEMPFYIGVGGDLDLDTPVAIAARMPVGLTYIFNKKNVPVDIYLQLVPTLWFGSGGSTAFRVYPELGAHYYF